VKAVRLNFYEVEEFYDCFSGVSLESTCAAVVGQQQDLLGGVFVGCSDVEGRSGGLGLNDLITELLGSPM
jgi:hypothetical protein